MQNHGEYAVLLTGNIIETTLKGSFNEYGILAYTQSVEAQVKVLNGQPFAMLVDDFEVEGGTPQAYAVLQEYNARLNKQQIIAKAFLINSCVQKEILLQRTPALNQQNIQFFQDRDIAIQWLQSQLQA